MDELQQTVQMQTHRLPAEKDDSSHQEETAELRWELRFFSRIKESL